MFRKEVWRHFDYWLFGAVLLLSVFGIIMIRSAVAGNEELAGSVQSQTIYVGLGMLIILLTTAIDYRLLASLSRLLYVITIILVIGINLIGEEAFGSTRWFQIGVINIQPSELAKIVMVLVLANYFSQSSSQPRGMRWLAMSFLLTAGMVIWILLQPNLSTSIVILVIWFSMLWMGGLPTRSMIIFGLIGLVVGILSDLMYVLVDPRIDFEKREG